MPAQIASHKNTLLFLVAAIAAFALQTGNAARAQDALRLKFSVKSTTETVMQATSSGAPMPGKPAAKATPDISEKHFALDVFATDACMQIDHEQSSFLYDFEGRRLYHKSSDAGTWTNSSLYSDIAFRVMEYQNRVLLGEVLAKSGAATGVMSDDLFLIQSLFGIKLPSRNTPGSEKTSPTPAKQNGALVYRHKDIDVVSITYSKIPISRNHRPRFARFLAYAVKLHPDIRAQIIEAAMLPSQFTVYWENTGSKTTARYTLLESAFEGVPAANPVDSISASDDGNETLLAIFESTRDKTRIARMQTAEQTAAYAEKRIRDKVPADGLLALMEYSLQTGDQTAILPLLKKHIDTFRADDLCRKYFASTLQNPTPETCKAALQSLDSMDRDKLEKAHVLDIQRGNLYMLSGQQGEAIKAFVSVLKINPFIAGVYKDLGNVYHNAYETTLAWSCWDTARRLYPGHAMLRQITDYEAKLESDFPDFFAPPPAQENQPRHQGSAAVPGKQMRSTASLKSAAPWRISISSRR